MIDLYLDPHQTRTSDPTPRENAIADVIERLYAAGVTECAPIVAELEAAKIPSPDGKPWSVASFQSLMRELGA